MSRLGKRKIEIPPGVELKLEGGILHVKGSKGELTRGFGDLIDIKIEGDGVTLVPQGDTLEHKAMWGTTASHITNMITGVSEGFEKKLILEGTGWRMSVAGKELELLVGYSHSVKMQVPDGLEASVEKSELTIKGIDKELVGSFSSKVRAVRKPEPYKGKGFRYSDEVIERKQGKRTVA